MSIVFKVSLTQDEINLFDQQFKLIDKENLNIVTGESVKPLFSDSGLSSHLLSQIWGLVDLNNKGFLNKLEFYAALRCIGHLQINNTLPITEQLYESPSPVLPRLGNNNINTTNSTIASNSHLELPLPTNTEIQQFGQLFDRTAQGEPILSGLKARDIFLKAKLNNQVLGEIWALCDRNANGNLERPEFIMAMYLIQLKRNNNAQLENILQQHQPLPQSLWNIVSVPIQVAGSGSQLNSLSPVAIPAQLSANSTGMSLNRQSTITRVSSGVFSNASDDWTLSFDKKKQFDVIFDSLDKQNAGALSSQVLVPFFLSSKLSQETLASIWDLADIHNNASFTKTEFAIAMFLIQKKNQGIDLPDVIPNELLQSQALGLYNQQPTQQFQQVQTTSTGSIPATIPSRSTKPNFQDTTTQSLQPPQVQQPIQVQNSNNGSLNDLMILNGSFSSPVANSTAIPTQQQQSPQLQKFTPTSNFGQNIIHEENEALAPLPNIQQKQAPTPPVQRTASVSLPQVPNFSSIGINSASNAAMAGIGGAVAGVGAAAANSIFQNNDLYADADASAKLSAATTDLANLSNQVTSISKQTSITNEKKIQATKELERVNALKKNIEDKLNTLRTTHQQNVQQTEQIQNQLLTVTKENETLQNELSVVEANYHAIENNLNEQNQTLLSSQQESAQLKEQIAQFNNQNAVLNQQLEEKQQQVKQERSMIDINAKQLELSQITVTNLTNEISGLDERLKQFLTKQTELDQYKVSVEQKHAELQKRYEDITNTENDLNERQTQLDDRNKQIEEQERLYHEHVSHLQTMFDELAQRKEAFEKADEDLKRQNIEYANNVQELAEKQMKLAMGELPEDAMKNVPNATTSKEISHQEDIDKFVDDTVENSQLKNVVDKDVNDDIETKTEKTESDVFDKDIPQTVSQSEEGEQNEVIDENADIADNFDGDLNEYGIPRTQSFTSSVANNAPQSVRDDVELPAVDETTPTVSGAEQTATESKNVSIPGQWEEPATATESVKSTQVESDSSIQQSPEPATLEAECVSEVEEESAQPGTIEPTTTEVDLNQSKEEEDNEADVTNERLEEAIDAISLSNERTVNPIDEEFPPIKELDVNESDSSSDGEFEDTKEAISPQFNSDKFETPSASTPVPVDVSIEPVSEPVSQPVSEPISEPVAVSAPIVKDEFDDEFADLEEAAAEDEGTHFVDETIVTPDIDEPFTAVEVPVVPNINPVSSSNTNEVTNDEWDEIFAGFGNGKPAAQQSAATQTQPQAEPAALASPPVNRAIATTPRALAVEELSGMGFSKEEATKALEHCGWDLDAATNYLLDSA